MIVDCSTCIVRGAACSGCVVTLMFGSEPGSEVPWHAPGLAELGSTVQAPRRQDDVDRAIAVLARAGVLDPTEVPLSLTLSSRSPGLRSLGA